MSVRTHLSIALGHLERYSGIKHLHPVRGVCNDSNRRQCVRFYPGFHPQGINTDSLGARPYVAERGGSPLSARFFGNAVCDPHHPAPRCRCSLGDGGRLALRVAECRNRRGLGGTACAGFHRHTAVGGQGRGQQSALLAGASGGHARSERCTKPLADCVAAIPAASPRSAGPWRPALAGGIVPFAAGASRNMGGHL